MGINWGADNAAVSDFMEVHAVEFPCASGLEGLGNQITEQYNIQSHITALVITPDREIAGQFYYPYLPTRDTVNNLLLSLGAQYQDCTTSTEQKENPLQPKIYVYPNPLIDRANIQIYSSEKNDLRIEIINNFGVLVRSIPIKSNEQLLNVDVNELKSGLYVIRLLNNKQTLASKIIVKQ